MTGRIVEILLRDAFWLGVLAFTVLSGLTLWIGERLHHRFEHHLAPLWVLEHVAMPLGHVLAVAAFLLVSYPVIYGSSMPLPDLHMVLASHPGWATILINVVFVATVLFSLLPGIGKMAAFVLPAQGMAGAALLFFWACAGMNDARYADIGLWPDLTTLVFIVLTALLAHHLGGLLHRRLGHGAPHRTVAIHLAVHGVLLIPVLVYAAFLGAQLG